MTRKNKTEPEVPPMTEALTANRTERWLKSVHITPKFLADTDIPTEFLQAQREAETILRNFPEYLTKSQSYQLANFLRRLSNRRLRQVMPIGSAHAVLNIAAKVNRQCFRKYRELKKQDKPLANKG
jgi:lipid A disaccharide synthetase